MANVLIDENTMTGIADAIREKAGNSTTLLPSEMPDAIANLPSGGGDISAFLTMPGIATSLFCEDRWLTTWAPYKDQLDWSHVYAIDHLFQECKGDWSGWTIEIKRAAYDSLFYYCQFKGFPHLKITGYDSSNGAYQFFASQTSGANREADKTVDNVEIAAFTPGKNARGFMNGSGLRFVPKCFYTWMPHNETYTGSFSGSSQNNPYASTFAYCHAIEEVLNMPVWPNITLTSMTSGFILDKGACYRLRRFTFETKPDGTPYECPKWSNLTLYITKNYGYSPNTSGSGYGKGFVATDVISTDEQYEQRKDLDDRCPQKAEYSDYGHDSALETIKSLPIVQKCTLTLEGAQGSKTPQGAVNTLTEAEIAIATEKNWTVTFV